MEFQFLTMTQQEAQEIAFKWHYDGQYAFYDMEADRGDLEEFLDPAERKGIVFAAYMAGALAGFISITRQDAETIELGLGMRPDLTGRGLGSSFLAAGLAFAKAHFSFFRVTLAVAAFNMRAIRLYEKYGFSQTAVFKQQTNGGEYDFLKMDYRLLPPSAEAVIRTLMSEIGTVLNGNFAGFYIHGSLAMGGFNPARSDADVLVITAQPLSVHEKQQLRKILLIRSLESLPIEITVMNKEQLTKWQHPSPFDFHFSEVWRYRTDQPAADPDLAAHLTVLKHRGFCICGEPAAKIMPEIPWPDYVDAILSDFDDCRKAPMINPVYSVLNAIRVLMAVKERMIASKKEAGDWGLGELPEEWHGLVRLAADNYASGKDKEMDSMKVDEFLGYIENEIKQEMRNGHAEENYRSGLL
ncbi:hypothetical protein B0X71_05550 [Planococcus lenghuensis]|uniref:N-acetyltransferase domain-containing protein n=2 Tax=Planococcus lenghuensis TaxID=2213202 RepID=A0A1Q2KWX1_9BACL|nr:hypothetical protein B0X71_05550 [Planococcus lenghuensis]